MRDRAATDASSPDPPRVRVPRRARVGGIVANHRYPVEFLADNLAIQGNVIGAAHRHGAAPAAVPRLVVHLSRSSRRSRCARTRC
jgi:hypothetical protein